MVAPIAHRPPGALAPRRPRKQAMDEVQIVIKQQAQLIDALDRETMQALLPALVDARDELRRAFQKWLDANQDNELRFTAQAYRKALLNLEVALDRVAQLDDDVKAALDKGRHAAGHLSVQNLTEQVARFGQIFGESIAPTSIDTAAVIAKGDKLLWKQHRTSAARYAGNVGEDIRHQLAVGVAMNESFAQLKARLVRLGGPRGMVALRGILGDPGALAEDISEGLFRRYRYWAERLVRTEMIQAYNVQHQAGIRQLNENRQDGVEPYVQRWDATLDGRVCPICRGLDTKITRIGGTFPGGYDAPPAHPNCRCTVVAWHASWGDMAGEVKPANENAAAPPEAEQPPPPALPPPAPLEPEPPPPVVAPAEPAPPGEAIPPDPFAPSVGDAQPMLDRYEAGKWKGARGAIQKDIEATENYGRAQVRLPQGMRKERVSVRHLRPGVAGLFDARTGDIAIDTRQAQLAQQFAERARHEAQDLRSGMDMLAELGREPDAAKRAALAIEIGADGMRDLAADARRLQGAHALVHEVMHSYGPLAAIGGAYVGSGAAVEEVTTEVAARRWMRLRLGIDPAAYSDRLASVGIRPGAYNGWIDGFRGAIERVFNVKPDEAAAMLEAAADRYKMRAIASVSDPDAAIRALADDISRTKRAGKDAAVRAQLEHELKIAARARP